MSALLLRRLHGLLLGAVFALPLLISAAALAGTDKRAVHGAAADVGPSIPEPSSILLFVAGVAVVGVGVHYRRRRSG